MSSVKNSEAVSYCLYVFASIYSAAAVPLLYPSHHSWAGVMAMMATALFVAGERDDGLAGFKPRTEWTASTAMFLVSMMVGLCEWHASSPSSVLRKIGNTSFLMAIPLCLFIAALLTIFRPPSDDWDRRYPERSPKSTQGQETAILPERNQGDSPFPGASDPATIDNYERLPTQ